jgi:hypothetical protein
MEALTRIVADSLARHGLDRPIDPRRLQWSRWFRCDSPHSLLVVPSKPGIFALAEEIAELGKGARVGAGDSSAQASAPLGISASGLLGGAALERCDSPSANNAASAPEGTRRMLAVLQFSEDDDMAFTLDRMFTCANPMRTRLSSGRCFLRFVVIEDENQRRTICAALNQWMLTTAEKATGIPSDFSSSLELASVGRTPSSATAGSGTNRVGRTLLSDSADSTANSTQAMPPINSMNPALSLDSGANKNLHCPHPLPSGF